ncbi:hypothetical protein K2X92_04055 [Candidatus Gracilibacteria bacterium]|nr:hypothetical protein [Candidatus Gracilibacteria bacterium]
MSSNNEKSSRVEEAKNAQRNRESVLANSQTTQKHELVTLVMESRLSRLQNYKLTTDSSMWNKTEYTKRSQEIKEFLEAIKTKNSDKDIINASFSLSLKDGSLIRDDLMKHTMSLGDMQKTAIRLMRADNGSDQVEAIAAKDLGELFNIGIDRLQKDQKAQTEIIRRTNKHFGDMVAQGLFDNATQEQKNAASVGLESMYQMRYIAKEYIDEKGGIAVPEALKHTWENYRDSMDIKDAWFTMSDAGSTQLASFLLYDLVPMIVSGGVAGAVGKGLTWTGGKATAMLASRMPAAAQAAKYVNSGTRTANALKNTATLAAKATVATTEAVTFDATFEGLRNQRLFIDKPNWQQDLIKNAAGFGFSRYLAGATKFGKIHLDPLSNQLIKQGLIVPAIITGVGVSQKLLANDPDAWHGAWEEFLMGAIMTGAFHTTGKMLEARSGTKNIGVSKIEPTMDGKNVSITTPDGQKFVTRMTEKLKNAIKSVGITGKKPEKIQAEPGIQKNIVLVDTAHGAPLEPVSSSNVAGAPNGGRLPNIEVPVAKMKNKGIPTENTLTPNPSVEFSMQNNTFRVELLPNGDHSVQVRHIGSSDWQVATGKEYGFGSAKNYNERIALEVQKLKSKAIPVIETKNNIKSSVQESVNPSQSATIDKSAKARIEQEHGNYEPRNKMKQSDILGGNFFTEMESIMKMDDVTFQKNFTEVQNRKGTEGNRPHEVEMYEAAAKVRVLPEDQLASSIRPLKSRSQFIEDNRVALRENNKAQTETKEGIKNIENSLIADRKKLHDMKNGTGEYSKVAPHPEAIKAMETRITHWENLLNTQKNKIFVEGLPISDKARIVAENAALRSRLKNILNEKGIPPIIQDGPINNPEVYRKNFDKRWLAIPAVLALLLLLSQCDGGNTPTPLPDKKDGVSPTLEEFISACESCYSGNKATIDTTRKINGRVANESYRLGVSERYSKTKDWKDLVSLYTTNHSEIRNQNPNMADNMDNLIKKGGITIEKVQEIQHCIAMLDGGASSDSKNSQDGMLGPITVAALRTYFTSCKK